MVPFTDVKSGSIGNVATGLQHISLELSLPNDASLIYPLVTFLRERAGEFGLVSNTGVVQLGIALEEALLNALYHGNLELSRDQLDHARTELADAGESRSIRDRRQTAPYRDRKIFVKAELSHECGVFLIRDQGPGFDVSTAAPLVIGDEPQLCDGRGLELMYAFMDQVRFNAKGNEVTMIRWKEHAAARQSA